MTRRSQLTLWIVAGVLTPLVIIGGLLGAFSSGDSALERVPVALVNNDELIRETDESGEETIIFASKPLVTELVTSEEFAVDWLVTGSSQARALLASGDVYAIVEIPEDFSLAVTTLDSDNPQAATFTIITDSSRSYLASVLSDQIGVALAAGVSDEFGSGIMDGLFSAIVEIADGFDDIAEGSDTLASGVEDVADGVSELNDGVGDLASGYEEFDDGLGEYTDGVTALSDGLDSLSAGTTALPELSAGVKSYTDGVSAISGGLSALRSSLSSVPMAQALIDQLAIAASGGSTLSGQTTTALTGVQTGIIELDKGADALDDAGQDLASGSGDIRDGVGDLAEGVGELDEGMVELSEGAREFSDGVAEGAADLRENSDSAPSEQAMDVLSNPVVFNGQDTYENVSFQGTLSSALVPMGLWLTALVYFLALPSYSSRVLGSTARTQALLLRATRPVLLMVGSWSTIILALLHTLGGMSWSLLGFTTPIIVVSALALAAVHFAVWAWNPRWLAPLSLGALIFQIVSLGSIVPIEILPSFYQAISSFTPLGWTTDALISALAGAEASRIVSSMVALSVLAITSYVVSAVILHSQRHVATRAEVRLAS
jgi:putative membrane protein